ncbi:hypothetical protein E4P42_07500 [Mycobacterium sp. PS03-16]|uniref:hypothetical protein n=1 Tax=Mycobacterium sp. PS03-16 TaxID=2559611 RepID=UPI001073E9BC|nr:hypothetical protein [Mycobacterium sp. PS03-16]TFV59723.1 hypothetical protein E4P42_07500 [Mycobacterium sp. PS03-16]
MPFRERTSTLLHGRTHGPRADTADDLTTVSGEVPGEEASDLVALAEAEAAEAEAVAAAARARARAIRLRRQAEAAARSGTSAAPEAPAAALDDPADPGPKAVTATPDTEVPDTEVPDIEVPDIEVTDAGAETVAKGDADTPEVEQGKRRRIRRPSWLSATRIAVSAALVILVAALAASGYMVWHHRQAVSEAQRGAEFAAAARQGVVSLMSLDFNKAQEDVQRIIDNSTGRFREDFQAQAEDFASVAQESKVITEATVNSTAVQSMSEDSAVVLVAATSRITNTTGARQEPRTWRLSVELEREGDRIKMSSVEFVP